MQKFNYLATQNKSLAEGNLLIAEPLLGDNIFTRTVILICNKDNEGTLGLITNNILEITLSDIFPEIGNENFAIYNGGPMQSEFLSFVHQYPKIFGGKKIYENVYFGGDFEIVKKMIFQNNIDQEKIKFFLGYSGWDANQLETEIEEKTWIISSCNEKIIFNQNPSAIWKNAIEQLGADYKHLLNFPKDASSN